MAFTYKTFPINEDTVIELNSISNSKMVNPTLNSLLNTATRKKCNCFDKNTEELLEQFPNHRWNCKYQSKKKSEDENKEDSLTYKV